MPDAERPRLMAFVLRPRGSADSEAVEAARTAHLVREGVRRLLPPVLERAGWRSTPPPAGPRRMWERP